MASTNKVFEEEINTKRMSKEAIEEEKVECCIDCKSLHLVQVDDINIQCQGCYSMNRVEVLENINVWLEKYGDIWITK